MMITFTLVAFAVLLLVFVFGVARGRSRAVDGISALQGRTHHVDLIAFRNLIDPIEEAYLRQHLSSRDFRSIHRERLRAALDYVRCVGGNAAVLLRLGEAAQRSENPEVAAAGRELVNHALRVRLYVLLTEIRFHAGILIPGVEISSAALSDAYENLTGLVGRLGRLQQYPHTARLASTL